MAIETAPATKPAKQPTGREKKKAKKTGGSAHHPRRVHATSTAPASGVGEVASKALGVDSPGQLGFLLPLVLIAALVAAIAYRLRKPGHPAA